MGKPVYSNKYFLFFKKNISKRKNADFQPNDFNTGHQKLKFLVSASRRIPLFRRVKNAVLEYSFFKKNKVGKKFNYQNV